MKRLSIVTLATALLAVPSMALLPAPAPTPVSLPDEKLSLDEGRYFGSALAADGNILVVGSSPIADNRYEDWVLVYQNQGDGWIEVARLDPGDDPVPDDGMEDQADKNEAFGYAVAVDGEAERIVVGDPGYDVENETQAGAVYVYDRRQDGTWDRSGMVCCPIVNGDENELPGIHRDQPGFGYSLSVEGERILVGAPNANRSTGKAWLFEEDETGEWKETANFTEERTQPDWGAQFGEAVDIDGETIAISAENSLEGDGEYGAIYMYEHDGTGWERVERLTSPPEHRGNPWGVFGNALDLEGDTLLTADPLPKGNVVFQFDPRDHGEGDKGYVFDKKDGEWMLSAVLDPNGPVQEWDPRLGSDVALSEDGRRAVLGGITGTPRALYAGTTYIFDRVDEGEWMQSSRLVSNETGYFDQFGYATAIWGDEVFVGAPYDGNPRGNETKVRGETSWAPFVSSKGRDAGSVFAFLLPPVPDEQATVVG